jgi:acyl-CoA dehydrogenase
MPARRAAGGVDAECVRLVQLLGSAGWLRHAVAGTAHGAAQDTLDTRQLCLLRQTLAYHNGLSDFAFAMQGLGSGAISLMAQPNRRTRYLPRVARGEAMAAFALSEPDAGSDVAAMQCSASAIEGDDVLHGTQDLDQQRRHCRFLRGLCAHGEAPGRARHQRLHRGRRPPGW